MTNKKWIFLIFFVAILFRLVNLHFRFPYSGEVGDNLLDLKNAYEMRQAPLLGPPTSHPWLYFGPLYYWVLMPFWIILKFNPLVVAYLGAVIGILAVVVNYLVVRALSDEKTAVLTTLMVALSPLWITFSVAARFYFWVVPLSSLQIFCLYRFWSGEKKFFLLSMLIFGLSFNFHYSMVIYLPVMIWVTYHQRKLLLMSDLGKGLIFFALPNAPWLINDAKSGFEMLGKLLVWFPYRWVGFLGLYPKNNFTYQSMVNSGKSIVNVIGGTFFYGDLISKMMTGFFFIILGLLAVSSFKSRSANLIHSRSGQNHRSGQNQIVVVNLAVVVMVTALMAVLIHGDAPVHYLLPVFPVVPFVAAVFMGRFKNVFSLPVVGLVMLAVNAGVYRTYFSKPEISLDPHFVPFRLQQQVTKTIITDADGRNYTLSRVGPGDEFEEDYSKNYRYLLWWSGNEPVRDASTEYIIVEDTEDTGGRVTEGDFIFNDQILVFKKE